MARTKYISIAPMVDYSDRFFRMLMRIMSKKVRLYTPMISTGAILKGNREALLRFDIREKPLVLQLGGNDPKALAECASIGESLGFDEINLNLGCPSARSIDGDFGAVLMLQRDLIARIVANMRDSCSLPLSIKCRLGVDARKIKHGVFDTQDYFIDFVSFLKGIGIQNLTVHARIAILGGLSPKQNRTIPALHPEWVHAIKELFSDMSIEYNGNCGDLDTLAYHLQHCDGVMLGRIALNKPFFVCNCDKVLDLVNSTKNDRSVHRTFSDVINDSSAEPSTRSPTRRLQVAKAYMEYLDECIIDNQVGLGREHSIRGLRHILHLYDGLSGAREWRRNLSENMYTLIHKETRLAIRDLVNPPDL